MPKAKSDSVQKFLSKVPVFNGLEGRSMRSVMTHLREHAFPAGTVLFTEGELGRTMYVVLDGEVEVMRQASTGNQVPIVRLGRGECFGEMALVELEPRSASVVATKRTRVLALNNVDLYELFREDNYAFVIVLQNLCRLLSRRLRKADSRIAEFLSATAPAAVPEKKKSVAKKPAAKRARATKPAKGADTQPATTQADTVKKPRARKRVI